MYVYSRRDVVAVECLSIPQLPHRNGFVTLKDFELPDDGFN
jgi:hypothetical protein